MAAFENARHSDAEVRDSQSRAQDLFLERARSAIDRARRDNSGITQEELLARMDARIEAARKSLIERSRSG